MSKKDGYIKQKDSYIIKENADGSVVTTRDLQLSILETMDEIHRICVKNNIQYGLIAGSALGIINYKGFVPWDDDIDLFVPRSDWDKFIKALDKDLNKNFYFQCYEKDKRYNNIMGPQMKIRKKGTYIKEVNILLKNRCKSGDGIFIDVVIYDNVAESKVKHQIARSVVRVVMPFIVLLDNLRINPIFLKNFVKWYSDRYARNHENSNRIGQLVSVPWVAPDFLKKDVFPLKLYDFEGRRYYSYNNIEKLSIENYGQNCLKKWNGREWEETLPVHKRKPKHVAYINLKGESKECVKMNVKSKIAIVIASICLVIAAGIGALWQHDSAFVFAGIGIIIIGICILIEINKHRQDKQK